MDWSRLGRSREQNEKGKKAHQFAPGPQLKLKVTVLLDAKVTVTAVVLVLTSALIRLPGVVPTSVTVQNGAVAYGFVNV